MDNTTRNIIIIIPIALVLGLIVWCWLRAGALEDKARANGWWRETYKAMLKQTDGQLLKSWDVITGAEWTLSADELRVHIRNLLERMDE